MTETTSRYHHGNLREELLLRARAMLEAEGPSGLSLRKVAAAAGVSRTAPYHHFDSKDALLAALVEAGFQQATKQLREAVAEGGSIEERTFRLGRSYIRFALDQPHLYALMYRPAMMNRERHPEAVCAADCAFEVLVGQVREGIETGRFAGDPHTVSLSAWATVHGLAILLLEKLGDGSPSIPDGPMGGIPVDTVIDGVLHTLTVGMLARD